MNTNNYNEESLRKVAVHVVKYIMFCAYLQKVRNFGFIIFVLSLFFYFLFEDFADYKTFILCVSLIPIVPQCISFLCTHVIGPITVKFMLRREGINKS